MNEFAGAKEPEQGQILLFQRRGRWGPILASRCFKVKDVAFCSMKHGSITMIWPPPLADEWLDGSRTKQASNVSV